MSHDLITYEPDISEIAVLITAKALNLDLTRSERSMDPDDWPVPSFLDDTDQFSIQLFIDDINNFVLWDNQAILTYLVSSYAQDDALYPKDPKKRAMVNHRLYFERIFVTPRVHLIVCSILCSERTSLNADDVDATDAVYSRLELFLEGREWIADDSITVADYCWMPSITYLNMMRQIDHRRYPNAAKWFIKSRNLPEYQAFYPLFESKTAEMAERLYGDVSSPE